MNWMGWDGWDLIGEHKNGKFSLVWFQKKYGFWFIASCFSSVVYILFSRPRRRIKNYGIGKALDTPKDDVSLDWLLIRVGVSMI